MAKAGSARLAKWAFSNSIHRRLVLAAQVVQFLSDRLENRIESWPVLLRNFDEHIDRPEQTLLGHWLPLAS
jgi:hypothetical protein